MKKTHIGIALCLLLALAVSQQQPRAQAVPSADVLGGDGMDSSGAAFIAALNARDYTAMFDELAPWRQDAVVLQQEHFRNDLNDGEFEGKEAELLNKLDPAGELGFKKLEEASLADPAKFLAFGTRLGKLLQQREDKHARLGWYNTERMMGLMQQRSRNMMMLPWCGLVEYENSAEERVQIFFALKGKKWVLTDFVLNLDCGSYQLTSALNQKIGGPKVWTEVQLARASEGEQLLGSARDHCRVEYAKTGSATEARDRFLDQLDQEWFDGMYYKVKECHVNLAGDWDALLAAHPENEDDPWLTLEFEWASGKSEFTMHDSQADMDEYIENQKGEE